MIKGAVRPICSNGILFKILCFSVLPWCMSIWEHLFPLVIYEITCVCSCHDTEFTKDCYHMMATRQDTGLELGWQGLWVTHSPKHGLFLLLHELVTEKRNEPNQKTSLHIAHTCTHAPHTHTHKCQPHLLNRCKMTSSMAPFSWLQISYSAFPSLVSDLHSNNMDSSSWLHVLVNTWYKIRVVQVTAWRWTTFPPYVIGCITWWPRGGRIKQVSASGAI